MSFKVWSDTLNVIWEKKKLTRLLRLDIGGAFNNVNLESIHASLIENSVHPKMPKSKTINS